MIWTIKERFCFSSRKISNSQSFNSLLYMYNIIKSIFMEGTLCPVYKNETPFEFEFKLTLKNSFMTNIKACLH